MNTAPGRDRGAQCASWLALPIRLAATLAAPIAAPLVVLMLGAGEADAQAFVEYPNHPVSYGDHTIAPATWLGGPTGVTVSLVGDGTLHDDGSGSSQRTARNTLTFEPPYASTNPQNFDELITLSLYGTRLPLLQQMSASGTSRLRFTFANPVNVALDLLVADLDQNDAVRIRAFGANDQPLDMTLFALIDETDLSTFKNTGTDFSSIVAPSPITVFTPSEISLDAVDETNYNRSLTVLRSPGDAAIECLEITFEGTRNSPNRASGNNASHVYVGLATPAPEPSFLTGLALGTLLLGEWASGRAAAG